MQKIKKITIKGKSKIYESDEEKIVTKTKTKDLKSLFEYLNTRDFKSFPEILDERKEEIHYKYYDELPSILQEQDKDEELIKEVANLHYKTTYYKTVSKKKYKEIYNTLIDNVDYLKDYYNELIKNIDAEIYL